MASTSSIIIGEVLLLIIQTLSARAIAAGASAEEVKKLLIEAADAVRDTDPDNLPDV